MSIIIVGVGMADFRTMDMLDDDNGQLNLQRDVVQFVPLRNYTQTSMAKLAQDTLKEVPKQLLDYMKQNRIQPRFQRSV